MRRATPYDAVPYRTFPRRQTHPDRLAAVASLFGMNPAPVAKCRVLEIGCGNGGNLIPLAYYLPQSRFLGIDLARTAISAARRVAKDLKLANLELRSVDLPEEVRDRLLAICHARLAPNGVAFISYNAFPGRYRRYALREMLLWETRGIKDPKKRLAAARKFRETAGIPDDVLFHDDLAPVNQPVWCHEFAAHAARHGLQYLGEADPYEMFDENGRLQDLEGEQRLDFRKQRSFRQTLLCRSEVPLRRKVSAASMDRFMFSENRHGHRVSGGDAVAQALHDAAPLPVAFEELIPYAGSRRALREVLFAFLRAGCADIHVYDFPCQETVTDRPRTSALARYQARTANLVTNACHVLVSLEPPVRRALLRLDGRKIECSPALLDWLAQMALLEA
jgi:SAM-dependent methyltransferase